MKASLIFPNQIVAIADFLIICTVAIGLLLCVVMSQIIMGKTTRKLIWVAGIIFLIMGIDLGNPISLAFIMPLVFSSMFGFLKRNPEESEAEIPISEFVIETNDESQALKTENEVLKRRILESTNTLPKQAKFFESLITLNEIQVMQSVVEAAAHFLNATQVSLYRCEKSSNTFYLAARYNSSGGHQLESVSKGNDRLFSLISESRKTLSIREISRNVMLHELWKKSFSKAIVYSPVHPENLFIGILTVDEIAFQHLNLETARNLQTIAKLTGLAFRNIRANQTLLIEKNEAKSKLLTEYQQFLKSVNTEFKRANRNQLPLSLLYIVIESSPDGELHKPPSAVLAQQVKENCRKNLREVDMLFEGEQTGQFWVILPLTDFDGLAYIMERISLITNLDLADQTEFACHLGFCSLYPGIQQPRQMIVSCQDSLQLHRTAAELVRR